MRAYKTLRIGTVFFLLLFIFPGSLAYSKHYKKDLAVALIFRDEAPYLKEWIEYHRLLGVERFYLYNNESTDNYREVLAPYIKKKIVELFEWHGDHSAMPKWNAIQCLAYVNAVKRAKKDRVKWIAIIDSDEFLVPAQENSLVDLLERYDSPDIGGVRVRWVMFGTSFVFKIPDDKLLIETLLLNEGWVNGAWKSIFRPERVDLDVSRGPLLGPHAPKYLPGWEKAPLLDVQEIQCNHYWTRDEYYFYNFKIPRRAKWNLKEGTAKEWCENAAKNYNRSTPAGEVILRFIPELRRRMHLD
jgi:hypothetical protein